MYHTHGVGQSRENRSPEGRREVPDSGTGGHLLCPISTVMLPRDTVLGVHPTPEETGAPSGSFTVTRW